MYIFSAAAERALEAEKRLAAALKDEKRAQEEALLSEQATKMAMESEAEALQSKLSRAEQALSKERELVLTIGNKAKSMEQEALTLKQERATLVTKNDTLSKTLDEYRNAASSLDVRSRELSTELAAAQKKISEQQTLITEVGSVLFSCSLFFTILESYAYVVCPFICFVPIAK